MIGTGVLDYVRMMLNGRRDCRICFGTPYPLDDGPFPAETRTRAARTRRSHAMIALTDVYIFV